MWEKTSTIQVISRITFVAAAFHSLSVCTIHRHRLHGRSMNCDEEASWQSVLSVYCYILWLITIIRPLFHCIGLFLFLLISVELFYCQKKEQIKVLHYVFFIVLLFYFVTCDALEREQRCWSTWWWTTLPITPRDGWAGLRPWRQPTEGGSEVVGSPWKRRAVKSGGPARTGRGCSECVWISHVYIHVLFRVTPVTPREVTLTTPTPSHPPSSSAQLGHLSFVCHILWISVKPFFVGVFWPGTV